jgi:uncharacterized protein
LNETDDQLQKLEERLLKAFELFKQAQEEKLALRRDLEKLRAECKERDDVIAAHERDLIALRREREEVRIRVEKLLHRVEAMTTSDSVAS